MKKPVAAVFALGFIHCPGTISRFSSAAVDNFVNILGALALNA
ncbi:hypothetical protein [Ralstonia syzygii]|nr:hypothetical protein [Ralstonia syzygii]